MKILLDTEKQAAIVLSDDNEFKTATTLSNFGDVISSDNTEFTTGFMAQEGTGILSYRQNGQYTQLAYQQAPGHTMVKWGVSERDPNAKVYNLEHPYKIWIVDFHKDLLVGLRHFFSPVAITDVEQPLFHTTLPNTNCIGYRETSVGWVCLYRTGNDPLISLDDKLMYAYERESGLHEPYNDRNMSSTDGPRYYAKNGRNEFTSGDAWVESAKKGINWDKILLPIKVAKNDKLAYTHDDKGETYTFDKALNDPYLPYYKDSLSREDINYYTVGWRNAAGIAKEFDTKTFSKLGLVTPPKDLDVDELLANLSLKKKTNINFDVFSYDVAYNVSELVMASRNCCAICTGIKGDMFDLMETFNVIDIRHDSEKVYAADTKQTYFFNRVVPRVELAQEPLINVCSACIQRGMAHEVPVAPSAKDVPEFAYIMTRKGYERFMTNVGIKDRWIPEDHPNRTLFSQYTINMPGEGYVPQNMLVECIKCTSVQKYERGEDNKVNIESYGIPVVAPGLNLDYHGIYSRKTVDGCRSCIAKVSTLFTNDTAYFKNLSEIEPITLGDGEYTQIWNDFAVEVIYEGKPPKLIQNENLHYMQMVTQDVGYKTVIDTKENLLALQARCNCGFVLGPDVNVKNIEGCNFPVCTATCVAKNGSFKSIIDY